MKVIIRCSKKQEEEIVLKQTNSLVTLIFTGEDINTFNNSFGDAYFDFLTDEFNLENIRLDTPVFINSVIQTCNELPNNCIRVNAWTNFLKNDILEIATIQHIEYVEQIMQQIGWKYKFVPNETGMIAPRIIAMIVNEAYFALEEQVSTKQEIDTAMKLGTNYPFGPFEWSEIIGLKNIYLLLKKLSTEDSRYTLCKLLEQTALAN